MAMLMFPIVPVLRGSFSDSTLGKVLTELMDLIISIKLVSMAMMTKMTKMVAKNAILDGCSTVDSKLYYDGIGWYSMVLHGTRWYFAIQ